MKVAVSSIAWPPEAEADMPAVLANHGIFAVDVAPARHFPSIAAATAADVSAARRWWETRGVEITGMQALMFGTSGLNLFGAPDAAEAMLCHLGHVCRVAGGLGARRLVFGSPRNRDRSGLSDEEAARIALAFFRRLGDIAAAEDVVICLEPNPVRYGCNFLTTTAEAGEMVRRIDHPAIRLQFDTGTVTINGEDPGTEARANADVIGHVHASEPDLVPLGGGETNHAAMAEALRRATRIDLVTVEMLPAKSGFALADLDRALELARSCYGAA